MSVTPRTDAARQDEHDPFMAVASECSKLERDLNEMERLASVRLSYIKLIESQNDAANDRIKRMQDIINRAHLAFFSDSSDRKVSIAMHRILDEEVRKEAP
jgi:hypothetical protein